MVKFKLYLLNYMYLYVEIGRQATLRWWCSKGRAGSNPVPGTFIKNQFS
jgi:hypothetical protein